MTDFQFTNIAGTVNAIVRTDLIVTGGVPNGNTTICQFMGAADNATEKSIFANLQRNKITVAELAALAAANNLQLNAIPVGGNVAPIAVNAEQLAAPTAPGTAAGSPTTTVITVTWTKSAGATGYVIQRATNVGFTTGVVNTTVGDVATADQTGLVTGTQYWFKIKAIASGKADSAFTASVNRTTA